MSRGIIYVMTTVVSGLVKIGKTSSSNFEQRMYNLEGNGYRNVTGLKRRFAIEVDDYSEKEQLLDEIFSKSRVPNSELFALDIDLVVQLLSSFEGKQVYPKTETKEQIFIEASSDHEARTARNAKRGTAYPDGECLLKRKIKKDGTTVEARMLVKDGVCTIPAGERVSTSQGAGITSNVVRAREENTDASGLVLRNTSFTSPSSAGSFVTGRSCNGKTSWVTKEGVSISTLMQANSQS